MQAEIDALGTLRAVHILGVNSVGAESGNDGMIAGRVLPWMQASAAVDPWTLWHVTYRDVYIVGPGNEHVGTYNLTDHDLGVPANYQTLMNQILAAANAPEIE